MTRTVQALWLRLATALSIIAAISVLTGSRASGVLWLGAVTIVGCVLLGAALGNVDDEE